MHSVAPGIPTVVHAGSLTATYEQGSLRRVRVGPFEVLRHVYFAVRDSRWRTAAARIVSQQLRASEDEFHIEFVAEHTLEDIDFRAEGVIRGRADSSLLLTIRGESRREFLKARIGLCVLHPLTGCEGRPCWVEHADGLREASQFPSLISPHQPFLQVAAISYEVHPGLMARVRVSGDVFETEDHRNWSDASFKTYSTPLSLPYPVRMSAGERLEQAMELTLRGAATPGSRGEGPVEIALDWEQRRAPGAIGAVWNPHFPVGFLSHLRVDLDLDAPGWRIRLREAAQPGVPLELGAFTDQPELRFPALDHELKRIQAKVARLLVFPADGRVTRAEACAVARQVLGGAAVIGGGSNANFAELNRNRGIVSSLDVVSWTVNPQVHAVDETTMIENLEGQCPAVRTARTFAGTRPLSASPVLVPPFPASAAWLIASLKHLLEAGIDSVTYQTDEPVLNDICRLAPTSIVPSRSSEPSAADALCVEKSGTIHAWTVNFRAEPKKIRIADRTLLVEPYGVQRIEWEP